ncbi:helix-turn-helix transcriptional regulator [Methylomonas albis]|jgi:excisionase family DNA binding protein|uniref:Helix-turn-helix domain-containing protein n=1 Tax=Methylomonas albis TaxID=1854563 RepID=A0ABR9D3P0_9GAMM|nr:helix-turn-helix domain-containing protein [Methylomonas albis]MDD2759540.1 helix-turn-helix domain-containing protein [Methylomonas sp.]
MDKPALVYLRPKSAAEYLGISIATFWRLVAKGKIPTAKIGSRTTVCKREDLDQLIESAL